MSGIVPLPGERSWRVYGLTITTPHRFANRVVRTDGPADLWVRPVDRPPIADGWQHRTPGFRSELMIDDHQHYLDVIQTPEATVFHFSEVVDFFVLGDGIAYQIHDPAYAFMVELHLLGYVLAFWLERGGWPAMHASAIVVDGHAIAFMGDHGGGKTSLAATMLRLGYPLLSDDLVGLTRTAGGYLARPGYPQMRMWPEQARYFLGHDEFERVNRAKPKLRVPVGPEGLGWFEGELHPLTALYVPRRQNHGDVAFETLKPGPALFQLVRNSYLVGIVEGAGLAKRRLSTLADVIRGIPVRVVRYPNGLDGLPDVAERITDDARALASAS